MQSRYLIATELNQAVRENASDARSGSPARCGCVDRISKTVEYTLLVFIVLTTLLGNYATHSYLMGDILIL